MQAVKVELFEIISKEDSTASWFFNIFEEKGNGKKRGCPALFSGRV
jgi:hypothetical protein